MNLELSGSQCNTESGINFLHFNIRESANIISELGLMNADQIVTVNSTVVFKPFISSYFNLSCKAIIFRINRRTNNRRKIVIYNWLSGNDEENTLFLWVIFRTLIDPVEIATFHRSISWYDSTSRASAFSLSAWSLNSSMSRASDFSVEEFCKLRSNCGSEEDSLRVLAGVNVIITDSVGISLGTSIISLRFIGNAG